LTAAIVGAWAEGIRKRGQVGPVCDAMPVYSRIDRDKIIDRLKVGGESSPVGCPDFKSGRGRESVSGGFDTLSLPPETAKARAGLTTSVRFQRLGRQNLSTDGLERPPLARFAEPIPVFRIAQFQF